MINNKKYVFEINKILCKKLKNNINATLVFQYLLSELENKNVELSVASSYFTEKFLMSSRELRTAINAIAEIHKTYQEYLKSENKFNGKLFATYFDFSKKENVFMIDTNNIETFLFDLKYIVDDTNSELKEKDVIQSKQEMEDIMEATTHELNFSVPQISFVKNNKLHIFHVDKFITSSEKLKISFENFFICRSQKIVTQQIVDYYLEQLKALSNSDVDTAIKICERSVLYNWSDLYALDKQKYSSGANGKPKEKIWKSFDRMKLEKDEMLKRFKTNKEKEQFKKLADIFGDDE